MLCWAWWVHGAGGQQARWGASVVCVSLCRFHDLNIVARVSPAPPFLLSSEQVQLGHSGNALPSYRQEVGTTVAAQPFAMPESSQQFVQLEGQRSTCLFSKTSWEKMQDIPLAACSSLRQGPRQAPWWSRWGPCASC